jgi:hypothetical protein
MVWNKPFFGHLRVFAFVSWAHILNDCRKRLNEKIHACIMMGYSEESKSYQLFDPIRLKIIIRSNFQFDDKSSKVKLLNSSFVLLQDNPFFVVLDTGSHAPCFTPLTGPSKLLLVSTQPLISESTCPMYSI